MVSQDHNQYTPLNFIGRRYNELMSMITYGNIIYSFPENYKTHDTQTEYFYLTTKQ